jgi:hypothetical protein
MFGEFTLRILIYTPESVSLLTYITLILSRVNQERQGKNEKNNHSHC